MNRHGVARPGEREAAEGYCRNRVLYECSKIGLAVPWAAGLPFQITWNAGMENAG
jgi:hypothetical protein